MPLNNFIADQGPPSTNLFWIQNKIGNYVVSRTRVAPGIRMGSSASRAELVGNKDVPATFRIHDIQPIYAYYYASKRAGRKEGGALFPKFVKRKPERDQQQARERFAGGLE